MSYAAIYSVTQALRMLLRSQLVQASSSAVVTLLPPGDALPEVSGVNLYLYRVMESPSTRNQDWRGDRVTPPALRPVLGLQLSYLLTPLGTRPDETFTLGDDAHTMLGVAMLTLHENPILNDIHLPGFDADAVLPDYLRNSFERVKVTLMPTGLEELSKIWATINKPYRLSVAYEVSLVELTPTPPPPVGGGIVLVTGVDVVTIDPPRLGELSPAGGALARVQAGALAANTLEIRGFGLSFPGQSPTVTVGGRTAAIADMPAPDDQALTVTLPTDLDAGPQADVRVTVNGRTSTPLPFLVTPWLALLRPIRTALDPAGGPADLKLTLTGNGFTATPQAVRFEGPGGTTTVTAFDAGGGDTAATVTIPTTLANGVYNIRIVLADDSASNARTLEVLPRVDRPIGLATVTVSGVSVHRLTLGGARLNGGDVRLILDGATYVIGANANGAQLVHTLGRLLDAGTHRVAVVVDGHTSRTVDLEV